MMHTYTKHTDMEHKDRNVLVRMWTVWEDTVGIGINACLALLAKSKGVRQHRHIEHHTSLKTKATISGVLSYLSQSLKKRKILVSMIVFILLTIPIVYLSLRYLSPVEAVQWWPDGGNAWKMRKQLTVTNNSAANLSSGTTVAITMDTSALVSAGKLQSDCDDLRILYQPSSTTTTEVTRHLIFPSGTTCSTSTTTKVYFKLQAALNTTISTTDYYSYYNNSGASTPSSTDNAFDVGSADATLVCPFDGSTTCAAGETPSTESGAVRYSGSKGALNLDGSNDYVDSSGTMQNLLGTTTAGSFTIEAWTYFNAPIPNQPDTYWLGSSGQYINSIAIGNTWSLIRVRANSTIIECAAPTPNTWIHIAVSYDGATLRLFKNGTSCGTASTSSITNSTSGVFRIGASAYNNGNYPMRFDEVRVSNTSRYNGNFTPSTIPFIRDSNTKLLFHFDENGDDPRNTGKVIDDSGNGYHGTITGAKYVAGLVGVDASTSDTGNVPRQSYAAHEGVFIEEGTTNKITNPSFDHSTYNTNWNANYLGSFTAAMSKRNSAGPFAAGALVQSRRLIDTLIGDTLTASVGTQVAGNFYQNADSTQGTVVAWVTPEWNGSEVGSLWEHIWGLNSSGVYGLMVRNGSLSLYTQSGVITGPSVASWTAGTTYNVAVSWDEDTTLDGTNYVRFSVNDTHTFARTTPFTMGTPTSISVGFSGTYFAYTFNGIIEGLTVYRRPLFDGTYGVNAGNGDEVNSIYNSGTGKDPTEVTGSWDVVFDLPTNASTGSLATGTGNAWSHPHSSNLLYTSTTNTGRSEER